MSKKKQSKPAKGDTPVPEPLQDQVSILPWIQTRHTPDLSSLLTRNPWQEEMERMLTRIGDSITDASVYDQELSQALAAFHERVDIFMRMTLIALDSIQMQVTGISTVKMTAFDPPLHHIPEHVLSRFIPPGQKDPLPYSHNDTGS